MREVPLADTRGVVHVDCSPHRSGRRAGSLDPNGGVGAIAAAAQGADRLVGRTATGRAAVFFDRDGVLATQEIRDGRSFAVRRLEDFAVYADAEESVRRVKALGAFAVVVTNQPDVGNGVVDRAVVEEMHVRLRLMVPVDAVYACYHTRADNCVCRKPKPGMLLAASQDLGIDLSRSVMVGDRATDIAAGHAAGCRAILIAAGSGDDRSSGADWIAANLTEAVDHICAYVAAGYRVVQAST